jgi:cytoskeletal protein RodZ
MESDQPQNQQKKPTYPNASPGAPPTLADVPTNQFKALHKRRFPLKWVVIITVIVSVLAGGVWYFLTQFIPKQNTTATTSSNTPATQQQTSAQTAQGLQLDTTKNYGNKYANGTVPVGDSHYVTAGAKQGYVYVCNSNFVPANQAGAQTRGPWFANNNTEYDLNKKVHVAGNATWQPSMTNTVSGGTRTIATNDLPSHRTGVFPVASGDAAYQYDRNPNSIKSQTLTYTLNASPTYGAPQCVGGEVGVMLTGVALFDAFDAGGRDAGAWEVQDGCDGHPQDKGEYHYHSLSSCITHADVRTVIGFALDGFPITGPQVSAGNILTTSDLDECHGLTSEITLDSKKITMYHYVMTQDFPYSVSCFRSKATKAPGLPEGTQTNSQSQQPQQQQPGGMPPSGPPPHP